MTPQEKLVMFMQQKANFLYNTFNIKKSDYFNKKDKEAILLWSDKAATKTFNRLSLQIKYGYINSLSFSTCVFCLKRGKPLEHNTVPLKDGKKLKVVTSQTSNCKTCEYKINHGRQCDDAGSNFRMIERVIDESNIFIDNKPFAVILDNILKKESRQNKVK